MNLKGHESKGQLHKEQTQSVGMAGLLLPALQRLTSTDVEIESGHLGP